MKINLLLFLAAFSPFRCDDLGVTPQGEPEYAPGQVAVKFIETVSRIEADQFIRSLNLIPIDLRYLDTDAPHWGWVRVPLGEEKQWVNELNQYPSMVLIAELNYKNTPQASLNRPS